MKTPNITLNQEDDKNPIKDETSFFNQTWSDPFFNDPFLAPSSNFMNDLDQRSQDITNDLNLDLPNFVDEFDFTRDLNNHNLLENMDNDHDLIPPHHDPIPMSTAVSANHPAPVDPVVSAQTIHENIASSAYNNPRQNDTSSQRTLTTAAPVINDMPLPPPVVALPQFSQEANQSFPIPPMDLPKLCIVVINLYHSFICTVGKSCKFPNCHIYKSVIIHINNCTSSNCQIDKCASISNIIHHFCTCNKINCQTCSFLLQLMESIKIHADSENRKYNTRSINYTNDNSLFGKFAKTFEILFENTSRMNSQLALHNPSNGDVRFLRPQNMNDQSHVNSFIEQNPNIAMSINSITAVPVLQKSQVNSFSNIKAKAVPISENTNPKFNPLITSKPPNVPLPTTSTISNNQNSLDFLNNGTDQNCSNKLIPPISNDPESVIEKPWESRQISDLFSGIIQKMLNMPESIYFRDPIDPVKLNIPDYPELIREPMDFRTIKTKLFQGIYSSPWHAIYDIQLIFDNAFLYNKKNTKVHKSALKLSNIFQPAITDFMTKSGYCCAKRCIYSQQVLYCYSKDFCVIPCNAYYYRYDEKTYFCTNCFNDMKNETITVSRDGGATPRHLPKSKFLRVRNNEICYEPFVICTHCGMKFHKICVRHVDIIDGKYFYCDGCLKSLNIPKSINSFTSKNLPQTPLSEFIERRVNNILRAELSSCNYVHIRVICNVDKSVETKPQMLQRYKDIFSPSFPFKTKAIFAFQQLDDCEVCFFSMHTQEYGLNCPEPNRRRVYISYLDSVHYFQPKYLRTLLYHGIILSYLLFCKNMGFTYCHIWSCPPCEGDDYVFHCHSLEQKLPKARRLLEWYNKMIEQGIQKKIILEYKDIFKYFTNVYGELAPQIPYFDGDYWSNSLDDIISEYERDSAALHTPNAKKSFEKEKTKHVVKGDKKSKHRGHTGLSKKANSDGPLTLNSRIIAIMEKYREVFFILKLNDEQVPFKNDSDPIFTSDLMEGRSGFLAMARENHWEFSSLRHAIYSTKAMLYVVHQQMYNFVEFTCDKCRAALTEGFHCKLCESDYDLCHMCHTKYKHEHEMEKKIYITFKVESKPQSQQNWHFSNQSHTSTTPDTLSALTPAQISQYTEIIKVMQHAVECKNSNCSISQCASAKRTMYHFEHCNCTNRTSCNTCQQLYQIYLFHAVRCSVSNCKIPLCNRLQNIHHSNRAVADMKTRSRILNMNMKMDEAIKPERCSTSKSSAIAFAAKGSKVDQDFQITDNSSDEEGKGNSGRVGKSEHNYKNVPTNSTQIDPIFPNHVTPQPPKNAAIQNGENIPKINEISSVIESPPENKKPKKTNSQKSPLVHRSSTPAMNVQINYQPVINSTMTSLGVSSSDATPFYAQSTPVYAQSTPVYSQSTPLYNINSNNNIYRNMQNARLPISHGNQRLAANMAGNMTNMNPNFQNIPRVSANQMYQNPTRNLNYNQMLNSYAAAGIDASSLNVKDLIHADYQASQSALNNQPMPIIQNNNGAFIPNIQGARSMPFVQTNNNNYGGILSSAQYGQLRQAYNAAISSNMNPQYINADQAQQLQNMIRAQAINNNNNASNLASNNNIQNIPGPVNFGFNNQQTNPRYATRAMNNSNIGLNNIQQPVQQYVVQPGNTTILPGNIIQNTPLNQLQASNNLTHALNINNGNYLRPQSFDMASYTQENLNNQLLNSIFNNQTRGNIQINSEPQNEAQRMININASPNQQNSTASRSRQSVSVGVVNMSDAQLMNNVNNTNGFKVVDSRLYNNNAPVTLQNHPYYINDRNKNIQYNVATPIQNNIINPQQNLIQNNIINPQQNLIQNNINNSIQNQMQNDINNSIQNQLQNGLGNSNPNQIQANINNSIQNQLQNNNIMNSLHNPMSANISNFMQGQMNPNMNNLYPMNIMFQPNNRYPNPTGATYDKDLTNLTTPSSGNN